MRYDQTNYISYDAIGNPLYYVNGPDQGYAYVFSWQNGRQLASGTKGTTEFAYTYNADGLRTKKVVDGVTTEYYWAGSQLAMMIVNPDLSTKKVLKFYYDAEGIPMCLDYNGTVYYYITNLQGDVVALADQYGEVIRYEYDAWGKPISTYYAATPYHDAMYYNPLRYRGYIYDNETGFYYLQSRYYDPVVGRFINSDSYASTGTGVLGYNMFAYCNNNPSNKVDYYGCVPMDFFKEGDYYFGSEEDAFKDFADKYNPKSIQNNWEYATYIYKVELLLFRNFKITLYSYYEPWTDQSADSVSIRKKSEIAKAEKHHRIVAIGHTHAAYVPNCDNENFSGYNGDIGVAENRNLNIYVATPGGRTKQYNYQTNETSVLKHRTYHDYRTKFNFIWRTHRCSSCAN